MLTSRELLAAVRAAQSIESNYRLARVLDVPEKSVSRWNTNKHTPDDATAVKLAGMAGMDAAGVLAAMHAQRCTDDAIASVWRTIAQRAQAAAAVVLTAILSVCVTYTPDAQARASIDENAPASTSSAHVTSYTLARFVRLAFDRLVKFLAPAPMVPACPCT